MSHPEPCKTDANSMQMHMQTPCKTDANAYINQETKNTSKSIMPGSQFFDAAHRPLRPYQEQAIQSLRMSLGQGHKRPVLQIPTGGGKTRTAGEIIRMARAKGTRVAFVVPAISLVDQTVESLQRDGIDDIGVIQADHWMTRPDAAVQVCSIQTLERRDLPVGIGLVIVDEAHRGYRFLYRWMAEWSSVPFIGMSATPWSRGMGKHWDDLVVANSTAGMIAEGYLSPFRVYAPGHPDLTGVRTVAGDYHEGELGDAMDKTPLIADIVDSWLRHGAGRPTLLFAVNRAHAKHCQQEFQSAGITAEYIDAYTEPEERRIIGSRLERGEVSVVCNVGCLTTGVDWDVRCIVLARPTRSEILFVQMIGRGLRLADGKDHCVILDHSDTHQRLGFVTDIHHERLDDGRPQQKQERKERELLPKECAKCHYLRPPKVGKCPACGYVPERTHHVDHVDGELVEITRGKSEKREKVPKQTQQDWYSMLLGYAIGTGKKEGWAYYKFKEKFKREPSGLKRSPAKPSAELSAWITSRNIARARSNSR